MEQIAAAAVVLAIWVAVAAVVWLALQPLMLALIALMAKHYGYEVTTRYGILRQSLIGRAPNSTLTVSLGFSRRSAK